MKNQKMKNELGGSWLSTPRAPKTSPSLDFHRLWLDFGRFFFLRPCACKKFPSNPLQVHRSHCGDESSRCSHNITSHAGARKHRDCTCHSAACNSCSTGVGGAEAPRRQDEKTHGGSSAKAGELAHTHSSFHTGLKHQQRTATYTRTGGND